MDSDSSLPRMSQKDLLIVLVISLGSFMAGLDATIVNIALPNIAKAFDVSTVLASWVLNAYLIILVSLLLTAAKIGDIKGYRGIFIGGFIIFTIGSVLCGTASSIELLIFFRIIQATGGAVIAALGSVMVTSYLSSMVRGQALGLVAMFTMLGVALGPVIGGFLTGAFSWRFIFYVNLPVGILAIILGIIYIPRKDPVSPLGRLDIPGIVLLFIALGSLIVGLNHIQAGDTVSGVGALLLSVIGFLFLFIREKKIKEPLFNLSLLKNRAYAFQNGIMMILQIGLAGVMFLMPFYLEIIRELPTGTAGALLLALPVGNILTAPIAGRISDVIGTKKPILVGLILMVIALFFLSGLSALTRVENVVVYLFLLGAGAGIAFAPLNSAVMGESPLPERGMTSGLMKMMTNLGSTLGVTLTLLVASFSLGPKMAEIAAHKLPHEELMTGFDSAFFFCMILQILAIILILSLKEPDKRNTSYDEMSI